MQCSDKSYKVNIDLLPWIKYRLLLDNFEIGAVSGLIHNLFLSCLKPSWYNCSIFDTSEQNEDAIDLQYEINMMNKGLLGKNY